jgi:hypothetical protein
MSDAPPVAVDDPRSDETLMEAFRDGEAEAFALLVFRH